jgi:hypothetical protein
MAMAPFAPAYASVAPQGIGVTADESTVTIPGTSYSVNYVIVNPDGLTGDVSYTVDGEPAEATPVLKDGSLVKIEIPGKTEAALEIKSADGAAVATTLHFAEPGRAAPDTVYAAVPMKFSEFYYSIQPTGVLSTDTAFAPGGTVAAPALFVTQGTRSGNVVGGVDTPTYEEGDALEKVDAVSTATYGDTVHFAMDGNLTLTGERQSNTDPTSAITGIKEAGVKADFDLLANASLLEQAGKATDQSSNVLAKLTQEGARTVNIAAAGKILAADGTEAESLGLYAALPLLTDGNYGAREIVNASAGRSLPGLGNGGSAEGVSYGGNWGDIVTGFSFGDAAALGEEFSGANYWDNFANNIYGGLIADSDGHTEPLLPHLNLFTHRMHEDFDVAISPSRFERFKSLNPADTWTVVVYVQGFEDVTFSFDVKEYINSAAAIDGATTIPVTSTSAATPATVNLKGLTDADAYASGAKLLKGGEEVAASAYSLKAGAGGTAALSLKKALFADGSWPGSYSIAYETDSVISKTLTFTLKSTERVKLLKEQGAPGSAYAEGYTQDAPLTVEKGTKIYFGNDTFATGIVTSGRSGYSTIAEDGGAAVAAGAALAKGDDGTYAINLAADVFKAGGSYVLTLVSAGFDNQVYYLDVIAATAKPALSLTGPAESAAGATIDYTVKAADLGDIRTLIPDIEYSGNLEFTGAEVAGTAFDYVTVLKNADGTPKKIVLGASKPTGIEAAQDVLTLHFKAQTAGEARVTLKSATGATPEQDVDVLVPEGDAATVATDIRFDAWDFNRDGKVSLADLAFAQQYYRASEEAGGDAWGTVAERGIDVNEDGVIDLADFILIINHLYG